MRVSNRLGTIALLLFASVIAVAQSQTVTGIPPFSSVGGGPFDQINLGNLNIHFNVLADTHPKIDEERVPQASGRNLVIPMTSFCTRSDAQC
jgi:hypothetical protein